MIKKLSFAALCFVGMTTYAQTVIFTEDFENEESRNSWTNVDRDGDGNKWEFDDSEVDAFTGYYATSWSWFMEAFTPDNTLTSKVITLPNNTNKKLTLKFDIGAYDSDYFQEHYAVYVIPKNAAFTGTETPVFEETLDAGYMDEAKHITVDISQYAGQEVQLVFRHFQSTDLLVLMLDNIQVLEEAKLAVAENQNIAINIYPNPTSDIIKVAGTTSIEKIRVFDMAGKMVLETTASQANIENLANGAYIVNVYSGKNVFSKTVIKK